MACTDVMEMSSMDIVALENVLRNEFGADALVDSFGPVNAAIRIMRKQSEALEAASKRPESFYEKRANRIVETLRRRGVDPQTLSDDELLGVRNCGPVLLPYVRKAATNGE
jgi:hypothetical protein